MSAAAVWDGVALVVGGETVFPPEIAPEGASTAGAGAASFLSMTGTVGECSVVVVGAVSCDGIGRGAPRAREDKSCPASPDDIMNRMSECR